MGLLSSQGVPSICILGHETKGDLLPGPTDHQWKISHGWWIESGDAFLHPRQVGLQLAQPTDRGSEVVAVLGVVALEPAGTHRQIGAAARDVIDGAGHVGEEFGIPVAVSGHEGADARAFGVGGHGCHQGPGLEVLRVGIAVEREEVVPHPDRVSAHSVGGLPGISEIGDAGRLRVELYAYAKCHEAHVSEHVARNGRGTGAARLYSGCSRTRLGCMPRTKPMKGGWML